jgi:hypothetical protein|tara:strand:- start:1161 stop:1355 length:195 start_codon:yes stop_codon:yes gene_type:complete
MLLLRKQGKSYRHISSEITKSQRKLFPVSWVHKIVQRESTIPPNEEIIRHNICNVELQSSVANV